MKISYVTTYDAKDVRNWSGLGYYIAQSLKDRLISIDYIGSLREKYKLLFKAKKLAYKSLFHKMYLRDREPLILKNYAHQIKKQLSTDASIVFSPGTIPIAYLECHQPIVFWTDATFAGMINFYPEFSNLCKETIDNGNTMERIALERCKLAIYTSEWAAKTAIDNYGVEPEKVKIVPFGANIQHSDRINDIQTILDLRSRNKCKLLFLGVDWVRKGGDIALEVTKQLNQAGIGTELTIAGCHPPLQEYLPSYVKVLGFVSKSTQDGQ